MRQISVLFVCLGNICRSPLAEAAFRKAAGEAGLDVRIDSAGTANYHVGEPPDPRSIAEAQRHGIDISAYRGRQLAPEDFREFDWIVAMDHSNLADIRRRDPGDGAGDSEAEIVLLLDLVAGREGEEVADPWYGDEDDFRTTWRDVSAGADALVARLTDDDD